MIVCDACGCAVDPAMLKLHSDWHDSLVVVKPLPEDHAPVANPDRIKFQDC